ncbi:Xyloglucan O-acetyltransferase 4 [Linum grandiflorum]
MKNDHNNGNGVGATTGSSLLYGKKDRNLKITMGKALPFLFSSFALTTIFTFFLLYTPLPFYLTTSPPTKQPQQHLQKDQLVIDDHQPVLLKSPPPRHNLKDQDEKCDLFKGRWVPDHEGARYSNSSCKTIPDSKNCFRHGRKDKDFLNWRWKPDHCVLHKFDPKAFFKIVRGKTMAFVGDSVARNHFESLLCLLSQEETPVDAYKNDDDRNRIWHFPKHQFILKVLWSKFLIAGEERMINGTSTDIHDLYLDKLDENWARDLHALDYVIISDVHWFFRGIYLHQDSKLVGCIYCGEPNVTNWYVSNVVKTALGVALNRINTCGECKSTVTVMRTFSPSHFEHGAWNTGGNCNRTSPIHEKELNSGEGDYEMRDKQIEALEKIRRKAKKGNKYGVMDVTSAMRMRPDGHPGEHWGNIWMKGYNDCVHWCMPGPIDVWNDFLLAILTRLS